MTRTCGIVTKEKAREDATCSAMARSHYNALLSAADDLGIGTEAALPN